MLQAMFHQRALSRRRARETMISEKIKNAALFDLRSVWPLWKARVPLPDLVHKLASFWFYSSRSFLNHMPYKKLALALSAAVATPVVILVSF